MLTPSRRRILRPLLSLGQHLPLTVRELGVSQPPPPSPRPLVPLPPADTGRKGWGRRGGEEGRRRRLKALVASEATAAAVGRVPDPLMSRLLSSGDG